MTLPTSQISQDEALKNGILQDDINAILWKACDTFRGTMEPSKYKSTILTMFFLKYASDVWMEYNEQQKEDNDQDSLNNQKSPSIIIIPESADFYTILKKRNRDDLYEIITFALARIEEENKELFHGLFLGILSCEFEKFRPQRKQLLQTKELLNILAQIDLRPSNLSDPDIIGHAYDFLVGKFASLEGVRGGETLTPQSLISLMVNIGEPSNGMSVYDPVSGSAGFLAYAYDWLQKQKGISNQLSITGQEINDEAIFLAILRLIFHNIIDATLHFGNTLTDPKTIIDGHIQQFDLILANPPFSFRVNRDLQYCLENDPFGRFPYGIPSRSADFAFIQHIIASLNESGKAIVLTSGSPLFVSGRDGEIRKRLVNDDLIETVIGLGPNLLQNTSIPVFILVINKNKPDDHKGKILFINATEEYERGRPSNFINDSQQQKICRATRNYENIERFSSVVSLDQIQQNDYNLMPVRYLDLLDIENFLGGNVRWKTLSSIAEILRGVHIRRSNQNKGDLPILRVSNLSNPNLSVDDLEKVPSPEDKRRINYTKTGDILISRIGNISKTYLVEEELNGVMVDQNLYTIRLSQEYFYLRHYILEFLRSVKGQILLSSFFIGAAMPQLRFQDLKNMSIPIPDDSVIDLISSIQQVESELFQRVDKAQSLRTELFNIDDTEAFKIRLVELSTDAHILSSSLIQADSLDYQVRNFYPFHLAFAYRTLSAIHDPVQKYPEQLRVAENLLVFLATVGLTFICGLDNSDYHNDSVITISNMKKYFGGGISPGDWQSIAQASGKLLRNQRDFGLVESFAFLWFKGFGSRESDFAKTTKDIVQLKNDFKHDRGPKTPGDYEKASNHIQELIDCCYEELSFFVKYPIRLVQNIDVDWRTNESAFDTLVYAGDHQGLRQERILHPQSLPKDKLFVELQKNLWVSLYPHVSVQYCPSCKFRETYFIDRWDKRKIILKSFERGHTHENDDDANQVANDMDYCLTRKLQEQDD